MRLAGERHRFLSAAFGLSNANPTSVETDVFPPEPTELAAPQAGIQSKPEHRHAPDQESRRNVSPVSLVVVILADGPAERRQLARRDRPRQFARGARLSDLLERLGGHVVLVAAPPKERSEMGIPLVAGRFGEVVAMNEGGDVGRSHRVEALVTDPLAEEAEDFQVGAHGIFSASFLLLGVEEAAERLIEGQRLEVGLVVTERIVGPRIEAPFDVGILEFALFDLRGALSSCAKREALATGGAVLVVKLNVVATGPLEDGRHGG